MESHHSLRTPLNLASGFYYMVSTRSPSKIGWRILSHPPSPGLLRALETSVVAHAQHSSIAGNNKSAPSYVLTVTEEHTATGTDQSAFMILMTSYVEGRISQHPPLAPTVVFAEMALIIDTMWLFNSISIKYYKKTSCDKYKTSLENTSGMVRMALFCRRNDLPLTLRVRRISFRQRTCAVLYHPQRRSLVMSCLYTLCD